ncbi:MAG TPA: sulfatase-like hydrolase/transferase [Vicinamibacterales bacterium]|nr:sulfatase-like hydrolase/transferase [Vicinamibacterales bacterium]
MRAAIRGRCAAGALSLLLLGFLAFPRAQRPAPTRPNVLLVTLDTLRADRIGSYGYKLAATPNLDRLAREGVLFADATTQSPLTGPAHAALLTGQYPTRLGVKDNASTALPDAALTLAESLQPAGYRTAAFIGAFILDCQYGFAQGFDHFDGTFTSYRPENKEQVQRIAGEVVSPALAWLRALPAQAPFFAWVHLYDAHLPYEAPPPYRTKFARRPYDGEIAYVDAQVGRLLAVLSEKGALERTIVIAVGDHGEALGEHGEEDHGVFLYEGVLRIPWIVRLPNAERAGAVVSEQVRSIDLTPTVLDLAGVPPTTRYDGESVAAVMRGQSRRDPPASYADSHYPELHFGWSMLRALRVGEWKYIDAPRPELYDLRTDRAESRNVVAERSTVAARMGGELETAWRSFGAAATTPPPQPDPETLARLRSLGYVGIASPSRGGTRGPDPKDKVQDLELFRNLLGGALADMRARRLDAAIAKLQRAVAINERAYDVHVILGDVWRQKGAHDKALGEYDAAALLNPASAAPHLLAADLFRVKGQFDNALERLNAAARVEPGSGEIAFALGRTLAAAGRPEEALAAFQRAVAINPSDTPARAQLASAALNLRRFDEAEPHLTVLLKLRYQPARTHFALGTVAEARGDRAAAAAQYRRALAIDPSMRQAREALARVTAR